MDDFDIRVSNFKKEYQSLLKKYDLTVVGTVTRAYGISEATVQLKDAKTGWESFFYDITADGIIAGED